ncbi:hypothetical protein GUJ93_ZPchr0004g39598 [Zizania palustris]|uniref:Uncharacterized protein n=1 Tax=Zizania palustris TaxID=103762 RepID=A0A8J5SZG4_ZIZPA|nr:hypothetical protein GUJ93_ZPchr0004g39598 [Zizania palustris]
MPPLREASCCIRHVMSSVVLVQLLLLAAAGVGSAAASNEATVTTAGYDGEPTEMYICYLCVDRDVMLIRRCPIYWDECHLVCYAPHATAAAAAVSAADAPSPSLPGIPGEKLHEDDYYDDPCYVMKLYQNGSYVIVTTLNCRAAARCGLSCGGGDAADDDGRALAAHGATPAAPQGVPLPPPHFTNFQRCGSQSQQTTRKRNMALAPTTRKSYSASSRP